MAQYREYHMDVERVIPLERVTVVARNMEQAKELVIDMIAEGDIQVMDIPEPRIVRIKRGRLVKKTQDVVPYMVTITQ